RRCKASKAGTQQLRPDGIRDGVGGDRGLDRVQPRPNQQPQRQVPLHPQVVLFIIRPEVLNVLDAGARGSRRLCIVTTPPPLPLYCYTFCLRRD
ncbi:unnamed protein product, partial [Ixodes pacificus]